MDRHALGVLLIVLSSIAYSAAGFFTRLIALDPWTMLFWRGLFGGAMILCVIAASERGRIIAATRAIGLPGCAAAVCSTAATVLFLNALRRTSVADVVVIFAATPFLTAAIGWLWLRTREPWSTLAASIAALAGVTVMMSGAAAEGHLIGDLFAIGTTVCMSIVLLIVRRYRATSMLPAACLSALLCPIAVLPFALPVLPGAADMTLLFLFGTVQFGLGLVFLTLGGRLVSATENALISTVETPLAVAWVWICFGEAPSAASIVGGLVVLTAVVAHVLHGTRATLAVAT
jgi:drug/metabolite transporter (DMT)-like permease